MQDFVSFLPIAAVLGAIASAVHARYRLDHQREHLFHRQRELKQTIQDIELGLELADRRREEEMRILEQTPSPVGPQLLALRGSQPHGLPRRITNAHVAMLLQEIKQAVSNDAERAPEHQGGNPHSGCLDFPPECDVLSSWHHDQCPHLEIFLNRGSPNIRAKCSSDILSPTHTYDRVHLTAAA